MNSIYEYVKNTFAVLGLLWVLLTIFFAVSDSIKYRDGDS